MNVALQRLRVFLIVFGALILVVFGAVFLLAEIDGPVISSTAKAVIRMQIEAQAERKIDELGAGFLVSEAQDMLSKDESKIAVLKADLANRLKQEADRYISELENPECACRKPVETGIKTVITGVIHSLEGQTAALQSYLQSRYLDLEAQLLREVKIFSGTTALAGLLVLVAAMFRPRGTIHLLPASIALSLSTVICAAVYVFNQNWLHSVVFGDYAGLAYPVYMGSCFAWILDVLANRGRVTTLVLNGIGGAVGGFGTVLPC